MSFFILNDVELAFWNGSLPQEQVDFKPFPKSENCAEKMYWKILPQWRLKAKN